MTPIGQNWEQLMVLSYGSHLWKSFMENGQKINLLGTGNCFFLIWYSRPSIIRTSLIRTPANPNDSWYPALKLQTMFRSPRLSLSIAMFEISSVDRKRKKRGHKTLTIDSKIAIIDQWGTSYIYYVSASGITQSTISDSVSIIRINSLIQTARH